MDQNEYGIDHRIDTIRNSKKEKTRQHVVSGKTRSNNKRQWPRWPRCSLIGCHLIDRQIQTGDALQWPLWWSGCHKNSDATTRHFIACFASFAEHRGDPPLLFFCFGLDSSSKKKSNPIQNRSVSKCFESHSHSLSLSFPLSADTGCDGMRSGLRYGLRSTVRSQQLKLC